MFSQKYKIAIWNFVFNNMNNFNVLAIASETKRICLEWSCTPNLPHFLLLQKKVSKEKLKNPVSCFVSLLVLKAKRL